MIIGSLFLKKTLAKSSTLKFQIKRMMSGKAPESAQLGLIVREVFNRLFALNAKQGKKVVKMKVHKYKIYKTKNDQIPEATKIVCQQKDYLDSGFINISPTKEVVKISSLSRGDKYGRIHEYFDSLIRMTEMSQLTKQQHWHNYEVISREANNFKSLMPKKLEGYYGQYKIDQTVLEYNHYIYWLYGEKNYSKAMFREIKATSVGDIMGRLNSVKQDSTFQLSHDKLVQLTSKIFGIPSLGKSIQVTKQLSMWIDGVEGRRDEIQDNQNIAELSVKIQEKVEKLSQENSDLFENLDEIDIYFQDTLLEDAIFLQQPEEELSKIFEQKAIEYLDMQPADDS